MGHRFDRNKVAEKEKREMAQLVGSASTCFRAAVPRSVPCHIFVAMSNQLRDLESALAACVQPEKAAFYPRFFKTGKGEYGEGDKFLGVVVPDQRKIAKKFKELSFPQLRRLLGSSFHEHRLTAVFILELRYERAKTAPDRKEIYRFTLANMAGINNWDMVDCAGPKIVGPYMVRFPGETMKLYRWVKSKNLWTRRMSILSTYAFIREGVFTHTMKIAEILVQDDHDLIHKAVGWMLREVGNRDIRAERDFLDAHAATMPRTMLRYAIEKFPEGMRKRYLGKKVG